MESLHIDRRARLPAASASADLIMTTRIVREGILLQACLGTVGAVEYLKTYAVSGAIIGRVLSGERVRQEDRALPARQGAAGALC